MTKSKSLKASRPGKRRVTLQHRCINMRRFSTTVSRPLFEQIRLADQMAKGQLHYATSKKEKPPLFERPEPNYEGHVRLHPVERLALFIGSGIGAYFHPQKPEYIVSLGESTAFDCVLKRLRRHMLDSKSGREILKDRPRMTSTSLDLEKLAKFPPDTLGYVYVKWLEKEGVSPDTRTPVRYIDDEELAFVMQRYRECHDFYHAITGLPIVREGEIAVKLFEYMNLGIPMAGLGSLLAPIPISSKQRKRLLSVYYPWALRVGSGCKPLISVYWEKLLDKNIDELRNELGVDVPPDMRELRKLAKKKV